LIAAEPREFSGLLRFCSAMNHLKWPVHWARSATLNGRKVLLAANGAGAARAAQAVEVAKLASSFERVCSMGFCGALDRNLKIGDIFVPDTITSGARRFAVEPAPTGRPSTAGVLASIDHVAVTAEEKRELRAAGASAVEMEAAGVAAKASELGLPFYCIRSVTDTAEENFVLDYNSVLREDGRFDTIGILRAALKQPAALFPELIRLRRRCQVAAQTLGEFVADCRF